jgi:hypothetical protein
MRKRNVAGIGVRWLLVASVLATAVGCARKDISEKPPEAGTQPSFPALVSSVGVAVGIPLTQINAAANAKVPRKVSGKIDGLKVGPRCGGPAALRICTNAWVDYTVNLRDLTIAGTSPTNLKLTIPVSIDADGGAGGEIGKRIGKKSAKAGLVVTIDAAPTIASDWCPKLNPRASYGWTSNPRIEMLDNVWVDIKGQVEAEVNGLMPKIEEQLNAAIDCNVIKKQVAAVYGTRSFQLPSMQDVVLHANVEPVGIALSDVLIEAQMLRVAALAKAKIEVASAPIEQKLLPLPALEKLASPQPPRTSLAVPLRVPFASLTAAAGSLAGRTFEKDTPAGKASVKLVGARLYPSNERLVVALDIDAKLPSRWLDTKGTVYLSGVPQVEGEGTVLRLKDSSFSRTLDNELWSALSAVLDEKVRVAIEENARIDLAPQIENLKAQAAARLADPNAVPGFLVQANGLTARVGRVAVAAQALEVEGVLEASVTVMPQP